MTPSSSVLVSSKTSRSPSVPKRTLASTLNSRHTWRVRTNAADSGRSVRLDVALVERGLARSRTEAARLVHDAAVTVNGRIAAKPSAPVLESQSVEVARRERWVSRSAAKLDAALETFGIDVTGHTALDAGASTGGFSQVLLDRGAELVLAVDVGHGQLSPSLAVRPGLISLEGINVRDLTPALFTDQLGGRVIDLVVADLSFISLRLVLAPLKGVAAPDADFVLLIKPQFEVGRGGVREGIVREPGLRLEAILGVLDAARDNGLGCVAMMSSPIAGTHGNLEFLVHLTAVDAPDPTQWIEHAAALAGASA